MIRHALRLVVISAVGLFIVTPAVAQEYININPTSIAIVDFDDVADIVPGGSAFLPYSGPWPQGESSSLPADSSYSYTYESARDDDLGTGWAEGANGPGIGEYIHVLMDAEDFGPYLYIFPGWGGSESTWAANNRIREARVTVFMVTLVCCDASPIYLRTAEQFSVEFDDEFAYQGFPVGTYLRHGLVTQPMANASTLAVNIEIVSVYPGSRWDDTVIAEVTLRQNSQEQLPSDF